jgi:hypothetical protein
LVAKAGRLATLKLFQPVNFGFLFEGFEFVVAGHGFSATTLPSRQM